MDKIYTRENGYKFKVTFSRKVCDIDVHGDTVHFCSEESARKWIAVVSKQKHIFSNFVLENV